MSNPDLKSETHRFSVEEEFEGQRIDKTLSDLMADHSRARIQALIDQGKVKINGRVSTSASKKLTLGDQLEIEIPPPEPFYPVAENIPLDIVYEDPDLLVINKPSGLVVHPGAGNKDGTLVNAVLHHCGDELSGIGGVLRPGIVHRLDKDTSGLIVVAKSDKAHQGLSHQLADRSLSRVYAALVLGVPMPPKGYVDQPMERHRTNRLKMSVRKGGKEAKTFYEVKERYRDAFSLLECRLESGRTHQIRVHMEFLKYPIIGDPVYGPQRTAVQAALKRAEYDETAVSAVLECPRQALHARFLSLIHPVSGEKMDFEAPLPGDLSRILELLDK